MGGISREDVPRIVENLLTERRERKVEVTIRPEIVAGYYSIEWRYLDFGREETCWKPVGGREEEH